VIDWYHTAQRAHAKKSPGNPGLRQGRLSHATASRGPVLTELGRVLQRGSRLGEWASFKRPRLGERVLASADGGGGPWRRLEERSTVMRERLDLERACGSEEESSVTKRVEGDIIIKRPMEEVFDFCADERNEPRYNPRMAHVASLVWISEGI
jgi:hypothetical protein